MNALKFFNLVSLPILVIAGCSEDNGVEKASCAFEICDPGREIVKTISDEIGLLKKINEEFIIEVTTSTCSPIQYVIQCNPSDLPLPGVNSYVRFDAAIKESCDDAGQPVPIELRLEAVLQKIDVIEVAVPTTCEGDTALLSDNSNIDPQIQILNLYIEDNCLFVLVSYTGGCNQQPDFTLLYPNIIYLSYPIMIEPAIGGSIAQDCEQINYQLLRYDLKELAEFYHHQSFILSFVRNGRLCIFYNQ